jgi:hypothetical protein
MRNQVSNVLRWSCWALLSLAAIGCNDTSQSTPNDAGISTEDAASLVNPATCTTEGDCKTGVCVTQSAGKPGVCLECTQNQDCEEGGTCVHNQCRKHCDSSNFACPEGLKCDLTQMLCVDCTIHQDCSIDRYCSNGSCVRDTCAAEFSICDGDARIVTCNSVGDDFVVSACKRRPVLRARIRAPAMRTKWCCVASTASTPRP